MRLEVNLQNFGEDIYDRLLRVDFLAKLRDERKFGSAQHLIRQLKRDREAAALYWQKSE
jgi:riboflavin kinase/FMN adenylyltransferase